MKSKKPLHGASLYYASDKNIFDALTQHKVDNSTIMELLLRRNTLVSKRTPRDDLATYFARQIHDYQDHKSIANRLGVTTRRERITSMDLNGKVEKDVVTNAILGIKKELEESGDVVHLSTDGEKTTISIQFTDFNYKVSEFAQRQVKDGTIELIRHEDGYIIRNTHNEFINDVRNTLIGSVIKECEEPLEQVSVSLFDVPSPHLRSKFFHELAVSLPGFQQSDVTAIYVYKAKPDSEASDSDDDEDEELPPDDDTHIERVSLRGKGVTRSEIFNELLTEENYYITKISWGAREKLGDGNDYDIEATFTDPKDCTGFSFILTGVYPCVDGRILSKRRPPEKYEIEKISKVIEAKSRELVTQLRVEHLKAAEG
ncbi:hypothetical protein [uncultured Oxalicibacterium sp.]|uniref:hypothetical protein n=1 Tax=uncultured Oxalicibacterium sp. TaxID=1168540 RepID=UPI0025E897A7|nr:hypothetical protein [uncultured Oxalicibacterium sp.]